MNIYSTSSTQKILATKIDESETGIKKYHANDFLIESDGEKHGESEKLY